MTEGGGGGRTLDLSGLRTEVAERAGPFLQVLAGRLGDRVVSIAVIGDAVTEDFVPDRTEIRTALVLRTAGVSTLHEIAPLGKKYGRRGIAAPIILTPDHIEESRDVFPLEFLELRVAHATVYGEDVLGGIEVSDADLRLQVERELKTFLIRMRGGFLQTAGDPVLLVEVLAEASEELFPEMRGFLHLLGKPITHAREKDLDALCQATGLDAATVRADLLRREPGRSKPSLADLEARFGALYDFVHALSEKANALLH